MISRKNMLAALASVVTQATAPAQSRQHRIGVDSFSIRFNEWTAVQCLDYMSKIKVQVAHLSTTRELSAILKEEGALKQVRVHAERLGIALEVAMSSICPTARAFNPKLGTAEEQVGNGLNAARILGTKVMRVFMGAATERSKAVPIEAHMESTIRVLRNMRSRIQDSGVRVAMENHGDFQARELKAFVEEVGKDIVGVCIDSGNPLYTLEDPHLTLEMLAPYTVTSHIRDTAVWRVPEGVAVQWVRIGEGNVDIAGWLKNYVQKCPKLAVSIESIVVSEPQILRINDPQFWELFPKMPAWEFARFLAIADQGRPAPRPASVPYGSAGPQQCADLEASIKTVRRVLS
jgi:sugar phosphate isomerase/epimerase